MRQIQDPRMDQVHGVDRHVGARVRERRKSLRLSQVDLATALGLTFQQVQKYERGLNRISASKLFEISKKLEVPISWFFDGYQDGHSHHPECPASDVQLFLNSADGIELGARFLAVPTPAQREGLLNLMDAMALDL